ncbi:MAG: cytidylate kinase-like family protein [Desulfobacteraceae bacterium]|nr:cytidylate kinase-like family protein [Desulfobacteraceae bacterium]
MKINESLREEIVRKQVEKWEKSQIEEEGQRLSVITVSVLPGSGGKVIAKQIADKLGFDLFDKAIIEVIAERAHISAATVEKAEKRRLSGFEDFFASIIDDHYLYPGAYLRHLIKVIQAISLYGRAVIVGRGASFILPPEERFSIRIIAPEDVRIQNIARAFDVPEEEAKGRILRREFRRSAFAKRSFHRDLEDPYHYDLIVNMAKTAPEEAVEGICALFSAIQAKSANRDKNK